MLIKAKGLLMLIAVAGLLAAGCERDEMHTQSRVRPLDRSEFFPDGMSSRPLVPGTVARSDRAPDDPMIAWRRPDGTLTDQFPFEVTPAVLARGRERYDIFCITCHGATGSGDGMIVSRGFTRPPALYEPRLRDPQQTPAGHFVDVISNGWGAMYDFADRIPVEDRWAIAAYIRALQLSQRMALEALTPEERQQIERQIREQTR